LSTVDLANPSAFVDGAQHEGLAELRRTARHDPYDRTVANYKPSLKARILLLIRQFVSF